METVPSPWKNWFNKENLYESMRKFIFRILSVGPIPNHIAFIMDGNRRYARNRNIKRVEGHRAGFAALMSVLKYCYEFGVKYVTIYAFSIDNYKRKPEEVKDLMDLFQEKMEILTEKESIVHSYGIRVYFAGDLHRLGEPLRAAAENVMAATANNSNAVLVICISYKFSDEILHAVREACDESNTADSGSGSGSDVIKLGDIEKHMYTTVAPPPDMVVRTSGETRLSEFLLWQTTYSYLYYPSVLWPDISLWHLLWGVLNYQRAQPYLDKKKKQF